MGTYTLNNCASGQTYFIPVDDTCKVAAAWGVANKKIGTSKTVKLYKSSNLVNTITSHATSATAVSGGVADGSADTTYLNSEFDTDNPIKVVVEAYTGAGVWTITVKTDEYSLYRKTT
jgi:hypothetical protein